MRQFDATLAQHKAEAAQQVAQWKAELQAKGLSTGPRALLNERVTSLVSQTYDPTFQQKLATIYYSSPSFAVGDVKPGSQDDKQRHAAVLNFLMQSNWPLIAQLAPNAKVRASLHDDFLKSLRDWLQNQAILLDYGTYKRNLQIAQANAVKG